MAKLTKAQKRAKGKLTHEWQCAHEFGESLPILKGLVARNVAEMQRDIPSSIFLPRIGINFRLPLESARD